MKVLTNLKSVSLEVGTYNVFIKSISVQNISRIPAREALQSPCKYTKYVYQITVLSKQEKVALEALFKWRIV